MEAQFGGLSENEGLEGKSMTIAETKRPGRLGIMQVHRQPPPRPLGRFEFVSE